MNKVDDIHKNLLRGIRLAYKDFLDNPMRAER